MGALAWFRRVLTARVGPAHTTQTPRRKNNYYHPFDSVTLTCRRCGARSPGASQVPCLAVAKPTVATPEDFEPHERIGPDLITQEWADAFGPLSPTFRVPEAPPENGFAPRGGTFGGAGASASWDTGPALDPFSSSIPASDSPSSVSNSGSSEPASLSTSSGSTSLSD